MPSKVKSQKSKVARSARGFTLIELLVVTMIIGLLSSVGTVSYKYVRMKARDAKRVADIRTLRNAIETYFEQKSSYPGAPVRGIILGTDEAKVISDAGITAEGKDSGLVYLTNTPSNVLPGGIPYLYRGRSASGQDCISRCPKYEVTFSLESDVGDYLAGPHKLTDDGIKGPEGGYTDFEPPAFLASYVPSRDDVVAVFGDAKEVADAVRERTDRREVQIVNKAIVAPVATVTAFANFIAVAIAVLPFANFGQFLLIMFTQPLAFLFRRKKEAWGTVFNANTKVPVDLASVRLVDAQSGRPVDTKVTDRDGRYAFQSARRGAYRLEVIKPGYVFPADSMRGITDDGHYRHIYQGTLIQVEADGQPVTLNIPIELEAEPVSETKVLLSIENKKQLRKALALSGPVLGGVVLFLTPSALMFLLFLVHMFIYIGFKRMAMPKQPKSQGVVYDNQTKEPVSRAVVRIFSLPYHKVLETKLTDGHGRYSFYVGHGQYYLTVTKPGYTKTETDPLDFSSIEKPTFIASDLPIQKGEG